MQEKPHISGMTCISCYPHTNGSCQFSPVLTPRCRQYRPIKYMAVTEEQQGSCHTKAKFISFSHFSVFGRVSATTISNSSLSGYPSSPFLKQFSLRPKEICSGLLYRMLTEEETVLIIYQIQAMCNIFLLMMQALIICSRKRKIAMRANLRKPRNDNTVARRVYIARLVRDNDRDCFEQLRIRIAPFHRLVQRLRGCGLKDNRSVTVEEQVAMFLGTVAHDIRYRKTKFAFLRSSQTLSKYFHEVLNAVLRLYIEVVPSPTPANSPADCGTSKEWHHYFQDAIGAIDGTHFAANVPLEDQARYRNRKGIISQNVLVGCSFDMKFTYVLTGWEGSAHDGRVLRSAITRPGRKLTIPVGKYYLADAGYPSCPGFLTPYRGVRYHLRDQAGRRPETEKELYNFRHSSMRNVVERSIGLLKKRFAFLRNNTFHDIVTQAKIISACAAIHNFLRDEDRNDELWDAEIDDVLPLDEAHFNEADINLAANPAWQGFRDNLAQAMWHDYHH